MLHKEIIDLKDRCERAEGALKAKSIQSQQEKADMQFLSLQKDLKIQQLDKMVAEMQVKLEKALTKVYNPSANDIVKGLRKDAGQSENIIARK